MRTVIDLGIRMAAGAAAENWIDVLQAGEWEHPQFGRVTVTAADLQQFAQNFANGARGVDLAVDVSHEPDKGAVGWFREVRVEGSTLRARIAWTPEGAELIRSGKFRYFSPEFAFEFRDSHGKSFRDVLLGGALTNRPFLKELAPVELSEDAGYAVLFARKEMGGGMMQGDAEDPSPDGGSGDPDEPAEGDDELDMAEDEHSAEMAEWSSAAQNDLPDSCFAHISPGGTKDAEGKTTPRSLRHLPYKDASGKVDAPHVRNALARLNQTQIPGADKAKARGKLIAAARRVGIKTAKMAAAEPKDGVGSAGHPPDDTDAGRYHEPQGGASRMPTQTGAAPAQVISLEEHRALQARVILLETERRRVRFGEQIRGWLFDERTRKGRLTPALRDRVLDFEMSLTDEQAAKFAEIMDGLPPVIDFGERGVSHSAEAQDQETVLLRLTEELRAKDPGLDYRTAMERAARSLNLREV